MDDLSIRLKKFAKLIDANLLVAWMANRAQELVEVKELTISREIILRDYSGRELARQLVPLQRVTQLGRHNNVFFIEATMVYDEMEIETFSYHYIAAKGWIRTGRFWITAVNKAPKDKKNKPTFKRLEEFLRRFASEVLADVITNLLEITG